MDIHRLVSRWDQITEIAANFYFFYSVPMDRICWYFRANINWLVWPWESNNLSWSSSKKHCIQLSAYFNTWDFLKVEDAKRLEIFRVHEINFASKSENDNFSFFIIYDGSKFFTEDIYLSIYISSFPFSICRDFLSK